jgi:2-(1,2-epoxy-1,2-dihydrophenyl)acetyl-CoA isomerase
MSRSYPGREGVDVVLDGPALRITLRRPAKRNAIDDTMMETLVEAFDTAGQDERVRVIVLRGEGDDFCGGADIVSRNSGDGRPRVGSIQRRLPSKAHRLLPLMAAVQAPVVTGVQGWAAGIGLHLVAASDFSVAAADARLWEPYAARGFTPDSGATWLLPRLVGEVRARELLLLGRALTGEEAAEWGLVHQAVPWGDLDEAVESLAACMADGPTVALGLTKWLLHAGRSATMEEQLRNEGFAMELSSRSEDFREGLAAFREKRPPRFRGR